MEDNSNYNTVGRFHKKACNIFTTATGHPVLELTVSKQGVLTICIVTSVHQILGLFLFQNRADVN